MWDALRPALFGAARLGVEHYRHLRLIEALLELPPAARRTRLAAELRAMDEASSRAFTRTVAALVAMERLRMPAEGEPAAAAQAKQRMEALEALLAAAREGRAGRADAAPTEEGIDAFLRRAADTLASRTAPAADATDAARPSRLPRLTAGLAEALEEVHAGSLEETAAKRLLARHAAAVRALGTADDSSIVEIEMLRPLALRARDFALRHHLTLARPAWPSPPLGADADALYLVGGPELRRAMAEVCRRRGLKLLEPSGGDEPAARRWDRLRACHVAVLNLAASDQRMAAAAAVDLGIALALGKSILVVIGPGDELPFDLGLEPTRFDGSPARLADAVDAALYGLQRRDAGSSLAATLAAARAQLGRDPTASAVLELATPEIATDPLALEALLVEATELATSRGHLLLRPSWPGGYPDPAQPSCVHVLGTGAAPADAVAGFVEAACAASPLGPAAYRRCEPRRGQDTLAATWSAVARATHLVVDLSGDDPGVLMALGMARTLGRNLHLMSRNAEPDRLPAAIAGGRIHGYRITSGRVQPLDRGLYRFLAG